MDRRDGDMLISMPTKSVTNGIFIRESLTGTIHSKNTQSTPGLKVAKTAIELLNRELKEVFEEEWSDELTPLRKGGFADGLFLTRIK